MEGGKGYVPERNPYFKKYTTRTMRPVIDFDKCVKCTLCWIQCPDSCFDVTPEGLYDANMESCCGCGVCEAVCPAKDCVTMVREDAFDDNASQWEMWRTDKAKYTDVDDRQDPQQGAHHPVARLPLPRPVRGRDQEGPGAGGIEIIAGIPGENATGEASRRGDQTMAVETKPAGAVADHTEMLISGSEACAEALTLADLDVVTAYPIRPYDTVMQAIAKKIANGHLEAEYIVAEGEHSQFEIVKHASTVGARVFCGSSGVGWMYAMECLTVTPAAPRARWSRMVGNRALDDPGAFGVEHNDALVVRDLGWLLIWVDTAQEMLDTTLLAYRIAEDRRVFLPIAISADGAFLTHSQTIVPGAEPGPGRQVPAALRPRRPPAAPRQPDHGGPPGQRGLGHRDPPAERRGDEARHHGDRGGLRRLPQGLRPRAREPVVRGVHDRRRRHHPGRAWGRSRCR